jgi:hypothetical protein
VVVGVGVVVVVKVSSAWRGEWLRKLALSWGRSRLCGRKVRGVGVVVVVVAVVSVVEEGSAREVYIIVVVVVATRPESGRV